MSNREVIEWLRKKAEAVPMPGARKMYEAAAKALEAAQPELGTNLAEIGTDCISRQAAIEAARDWYEGLICGSFKGLEKWLRALPSAQPEPRWIPVTERLPQAGESVMICDAYGDICIGHRTMGGYYFPDFCGDKIKDVRAWCELPEPYKGVTECIERPKSLGFDRRPEWPFGGDET